MLRPFILALIAGCGVDVLFLDYPRVDGLEIGTEIIAIESEGETRVYASELGAPWIIPLDVEDEMRLAAVIYDGSLTENRLSAQTELEAIPAKLVRPYLGTFVRSIIDGAPNEWRPPASGDLSDVL